MPKVSANLKDAKTKYEHIEPGSYEMKVASIDFDESTQQYTIKSVVDEPGSDHFNKPVFDRIFMKKSEAKGGGESEYGAAQLRRYFEACLGWDENSNWDDADTDMLLNQRFRGDVFIENYETKEDKAAGKNEKSGYSNRFKKAGITRL